MRSRKLAASPYAWTSAVHRKHLQHGVMIDSYAFGRMVVDGRAYTKDLMILPGGAVVHPWWRDSGHELAEGDIKPLLDASPQALVVGTGSPGMMEMAPELGSELESRGILVVVLPTGQAVDHYNSLVRSGGKVGACFHLTC